MDHKLYKQIDMLSNRNPKIIVCDSSKETAFFDSCNDMRNWLKTADFIPHA